MNRGILKKLQIFLFAICSVVSVCSAYGQKTKSDQAHASATQESFETVVSRAQSAMDAGRLSEAEQLYRRAVTLRPGWAEGWWHLGTLCFDSNQFTEARDAFAQFVTVEKKQAGPGFAMLGISEFQLKHYREALAALEHGWNLGLGSNAAFAHTVLYHIGILHTRQEEPEIALQRLTLLVEQIAAAHPEAPKGEVLSDTELIEALGMAGLRIPTLPSDIPAAEITVIRRAGKAQALIALQDGVAAEAELKQLTSDYSSHPGVHYMYGVFLLKEHPPLAVDEFRREIEVSPKSDAARIQLALEFLRTADYQTGLKYAREAIALAPNNFVAHVACGRLWLALGKTGQAIEELRIGVKLAPSSPDAHFALSRALSEAGRNAEAAHERAEFERLQKLAEAADR